MATFNSSNYQGFEEEEPENKHTNGLPQKRRLSFSRQESADKLVIVLVGLPARGKSYIAKKIQIYLSWRGHQCRVFNVGQERRRRASHIKHDSNFFRADNTEAAKLRTEVAMHVLEGVLEWINNGGQVGIFDATNTTQARRRLLVERCTQAGVRLLFIESICNDPKIIDENLKMKISRSPDYANTPPEQALEDIKQRIKNYERVYETLDDAEDLSYIKIINMSSKLEACNVTGVIPRLLIIFVMNLHADQKYVEKIRHFNTERRFAKRRKIWICRAGNTTHDPVGDGSAVPYKTEHCALSSRGIKFSQNLAAFIKAQNIEGEYQVWTSTLNRAVETIGFISKPGVLSSYGALKMVHQGVCYGMSPKRIKQKFPDLYENWQADPFRYRFSGGESYMDVVQRLEPLVVDIEQLACPILIVTHLSCLRILYSYFKGTPVEECPSLEFPQGSVIQFSPSLYGWQESMYNLMDDNFIDNLLADSTDSS